MTTALNITDIVFGEFKKAMDALNASIPHDRRITAVIDNQEYDEKENPNGYAKATFVASRSVSPVIGNRIVDNRANLMVSLFTPVNCGVSDALDFAHKIRDHFNGMKFYKLTSAGKTRINFAIGTATQRGQEGKFNQILVDIPCNYKEYRDATS